MNSIHYRKTPLRSLACCTLALGCIAFAPALQAANILINGSGDSPMSVGWTVLANGGSGWTVSNDTTYTGADGLPGDFVTSYAQDRRSQTIDLLADGYTAAQLDASPTISVGESVKANGNFPNGTNNDTYYIKVDLLDANKNVISEWTVGTSAAMVTAPAAWTVNSFDFTGYAPGVRYVYFEDGGKDGGNWSGNYGTAFDLGFVNVNAVPEPGAAGIAVVAAAGAFGLRRRR